MKKSEYAVDLYNNGHLCSQAILKTFAKECGITDEQAMMLGTGFGMGMNRGEACGACTGALMVLGLLYGQKDPGKRSQRDKVYDLCRRFREEFSKRCGSHICNEILQCDVSTEAGVQLARKKGLFSEVCPQMVEVAADLLDEMINRTLSKA